MTKAFMALGAVGGLLLASCSSTQSNLWATICADQQAYVQQIPNAFLDPAQAALVLKTICGTANANPTPTATPTLGK